MKRRIHEPQRCELAMTHLLAGVFFESHRGFVQQLWRHGQVDPRGGKLPVSQVGRQLWQQFLNIGTLSVTGSQSPHCEGVPHVMEPRLVARSVAAMDADVPDSTSNCALNHLPLMST